MIVGAVMLSWLIGSPLKVKPLVISKLNTAAQIVFACVLLGSLGFHLNAEPLVMVLMGVVAALTFASIAAYLVEWVRHMNSVAAGQ
jgi:cardiolipin synthase